MIVLVSLPVLVLYSRSLCTCSCDILVQFTSVQFVASTMRNSRAIPTLSEIQEKQRTRIVVDIMAELPGNKTLGQDA